MKTTIVGVLLLCHSATPAQVTDQMMEKIPVLTLGTFHFNFPNLDARQIDQDDRIDVLEPAYQKEIEGIVEDLAKFKPTIIVIERHPDRQAVVDSAYREYLNGSYRLATREDEQIGFRLGKACAVRRLYCVDEWGVFTDRVGAIVEGKDSAGAAEFEAYYFHNPDSMKKTSSDPTSAPTYKTAGIRNELVRMNDEGRVKRSLGDYLVGIYKYEVTPGDFLGVDFETGRWFNRNLRIFRNIQRISASSGDRILVIFGAGHLNLLNYFFECSPEFDLVRAGAYLE